MAMGDEPFIDQSNEDSAPFRVLTQYCPRCGARLFINEGVNGNVYYCPKEKRDVTQEVMRADQQRLDPASTEIARRFKVEFPSELQRFNWPAFIFTWIWAFARGLHTWGIGILLTQILIALLTPPLLVAIVVLPLISIGYLVFEIWFGFAANRLDWEKNDYRTADEFRRSHRRWEVFTTIFCIFILLSTVSAGIILGINLSN